MLNHSENGSFSPIDSTTIQNAATIKILNDINVSWWKTTVSVFIQLRFLFRALLVWNQKVNGFRVWRTFRCNQFKPARLRLNIRFVEVLLHIFYFFYSFTCLSIRDWSFGGFNYKILSWCTQHRVGSDQFWSALFHAFEISTFRL